MIMKKIFSIALSLILVMGLTSCDKWLDVNVSPNDPSDASATVELRLPWIQHFYMYAWGNAAMRTSVISGLYTITSASNTNGLAAAWNPAQGLCTTAYQNWFLGAGVNLNPLIARAEEQGAYHYIGAAYTLHAMGFMLMLDLHGEMPYTEAMGERYDPPYDQGDVIYAGCLQKIDQAIEMFSKTQERGATPLSKGDTWNGGDVQKWIKLCYGLKARYLNKISKKAAYDPQAILDALAKAPQSNEESTIMKHYNVEGDATNFTVGDPYQANQIWDGLSYGTGQRTTRWFINMLTNEYTGGSKVVDPRLSKLVPAIMSNITLDESGKVLKYEWKRDIGVDMLYSDIRQNSGPINAAYLASGTKEIEYKIADATERDKFIAGLQGKHAYSVDGEKVKVTYRAGNFYINNTNYKRAGDTVYVNARSNSMSTSGKAVNDMYYYLDADKGAVAGTGLFYSRPDSDSDILTYSEMCFIKAEVYLRQGNAGAAHQAYLDGIKANFDRMQKKLNSWKAEGTVNPDQMPMNEAEIAAYMASAAVAQTAGELTMAELMKQKVISLGPNVEVWNDMRRFNYSAGNIGNFGVVFVDFKRPYEFTATNKMVGSSPTDPTYWFRRYSQSSHESNYNSTQLLASNPLAMKDAIWSDPVWWDKE
jgi:hypothetical protein